MARAFRDRASYKASDIAALFLFSFFGTMLLCIVLSFLQTLCEWWSH